MSYLTGLYNELKELDGVVKLCTTDKTISYLKNNSFDYMILGHDPVFKGVKSDIFITKDNSDEYQVEPDMVGFHNDEQKKVNQFVELGRNSLNCTD